MIKNRPLCIEYKKLNFLILLMLLINTMGICQHYPVIEELKSQNFIFKQYQQEIERSQMAIFAGKPVEMGFYSYRATKDDTMFSVSSRCCIPYDTLIIINDIEDSDTSLEGKLLILPTAPGLFIPLKPVSPIELLLSKEYAWETANNNFPVYKINDREFYFLENLRLSLSTRAFFLNPGMILPLDSSVLTSDYGMRISPISGKWKFHHGIDLAAPSGTNIFCCKNGIVEEVVKNDPTYGNYCIVRHSTSMTSLYAHMESINVTKGQTVKAGAIIGKVGTTGLTTGPHLHFEILINGKSQDPQNYF